MHGPPAATLCGRLITLLLRQGLDADNTEDDLMVATARAIYSPTVIVDVEDLAARQGRRLLAEVARLDVGRWVITITHPHGLEHVVLGTEAVGEAASLVSVVDGGRAVGGGLYTHQQIETLLEVGHAAWVADQASQPWTTSKTVAALAAASRAAGIPLPHHQRERPPGSPHIRHHVPDRSRDRGVGPTGTAARMRDDCLRITDRPEEP